MIGNANATFEVTREQVEALSYLRNPRSAAAYLNIPEVMVEDVWAEMPAPRKSHSGKINYSIEAADKASTVDYATSIRPDAESGSDRLREAILRSMLRWAECNGTTIDGAARFLMSGR